MATCSGACHRHDAAESSELQCVKSYQITIQASVLYIVIFICDSFGKLVWFKHILFMTEHEDGLGRAKKAVFNPLRNTHMHILLGYSDTLKLVYAFIYIYYCIYMFCWYM